MADKKKKVTKRIQGPGSSGRREGTVPSDTYKSLFNKLITNSITRDPGKNKLVQLADGSAEGKALQRDIRTLKNSENVYNVMKNRSFNRREGDEQARDENEGRNDRFDPRGGKRSGEATRRFMNGGAVMPGRGVRDTKIG